MGRWEGRNKKNNAVKELDRPRGWSRDGSSIRKPSENDTGENKKKGTKDTRGGEKSGGQRVTPGGVQTDKPKEVSASTERGKITNIEKGKGGKN